MSKPEIYQKKFVDGPQFEFAVICRSSEQQLAIRQWLGEHCTGEWKCDLSIGGLSGYVVFQDGFDAMRFKLVWHHKYNV